MTEISEAAAERMLKKAGAERAGDDAVKAMQEILENIAVKIGTRAVTLAKHAKRKTVRAEDVELAAKQLQGSE